METIHSSFEKCSKLFTEIVEEGGDESQVLSSIAAIESCLDMVRKSDVYSKGEELEEYSTQSLKFLCLKYYLGKVHTQQNNLLERSTYLKIANSKFLEYLGDCAALKILDEIDVFKDGAEDKSNANSDDVRVLKIAKYRREKEAKERMQSLRMLLNRKNAGSDLDCEEETRALMLLQLQCYARDAASEIDLIKQELVLLDHMAGLREEQEIIQNSKDRDRQSNDSRANSRNQPGRPDSSSSGSGILPEGLPERDFFEDDCHGDGISVVTSSKVGDQVFFSREERISSVFRPSLSAPTMTLEEYGDQQKAEAIERSKNESQQQSHVVKRYSQLLADGEEDESDLLEKATYQDREWDAWKEDNPKGSGNKMGKRY